MKAALLGAALLLSGCSTLVTPHPTSVQFDAQTMIRVGRISGCSKSVQILWCFPLWGLLGASTERAIQDALQEGKADVLTDVMEDDAHYSVLFGLLSVQSLRVSGTGAKLK